MFVVPVKSTKKKWFRTKFDAFPSGRLLAFDWISGQDLQSECSIAPKERYHLRIDWFCVVTCDLRLREEFVSEKSKIPAIAAGRIDR